LGVGELDVWWASPRYPNAVRPNLVRCLTCRLTPQLLCRAPRPRLVGRLDEALPQGVEGFTNRVRSARRRIQEIERLTPKERHEQQVPKYRQLIRTTEQVVQNARAVLQQTQGAQDLEGKMTQDQLAALYPQASIFVLPCLVTGNGDRDGIPNVLIEAMASGTPVISTNISGISELVEHKWTGLLVEQRNAGAIADAMETLLLWPGLRSRLAENARSRVLHRFTSESSAMHVRDILCSFVRVDRGQNTEFAGRVAIATS
jgi:glycosyltransferase involved in cell wall biosynthesis